MTEDKKGVTYSIRSKLNFLDERLWKRFSARRLELIDTLDLLSKKASEQDIEIQKVAEALRNEFNYSAEFIGDFDKLVRAAIQSVRRNRKRSCKSKKDDVKRVKYEEPKVIHSVLQNKQEPFLSSIANVLDNYNDSNMVDLNYCKKKEVSENDKAKETIDSMVKPRIGFSSKLPSISSLNINEPILNIEEVRKILINFIETSKSCSNSVLNKSHNLENLGESIIKTCVSFILEKSFENLNERSLEYLNKKMLQPEYLAKIFRSLDPLTGNINNEIAVISLYTLLGGCVKDFGFEVIMMPVCELFYRTIYQDYPIVAKSSNNFNYLMKSQPITKKILLKFNNRVLEFSYSVGNYSFPRYIEIIENAKSAFSLQKMTVSLRSKDGLVQSDADLERIFTRNDLIELEILTQSTSTPTYGKIFLPPPINSIPHMPNFQPLL